MRRRVDPWLILIVLLGAALRLYGIDFGLPYPMARPDEETALGHALAVTRGDWNPHFFHWPSLTFYLFAAVFALASTFGGADALGPATYTLIARTTVAVAGTATIVVLYALASRVAGRTVALLAALYLAVSILHVRESHFAMTDVLMTLFLLISLALLVRVATEDVERATPQRWTGRCVVAGIFGGLAASTKYNAAAVAAAMLALQLAWFWRRPSLALSWRAWVPSVGYGVAMVAAFLATTPYAVLDSEKFAEDMRFNLDHLSGGHAGLDLGRGWIYHLTHSLPHGTGPAIFVAALVGLVATLLSAFHMFLPAKTASHGFPWLAWLPPSGGRTAFRALWLIAAFALGLYVVMGSGYTVFFRYVLPLVPVICFVAAIGVVVAARWIAGRTGLAESRARALLIVLTAGPALVQCVWFDSVLVRTDSRVLAAEWLVERLEPGDTLHDAGMNYTRLDLSRADFHQWYFDEAAGDFGDPDGRIPKWLVLYDSPLSAYTRTPVALRKLSAERYDLVHTVRTTRSGARSATYDHQDAFFLPVNGFYTIERPGPNVRIYRRRD